MQNIISSLFLILLGIIISIFSYTYNIGTISNIGSGGIPFVLGLFLTIIGFLLLITNIKSNQNFEELNKRNLFFVVLSIISFIFLLNIIGSILTFFICLFIVSFADKNFSMKESFAISISSAILSLFIFKYIIKIPGL